MAYYEKKYNEALNRARTFYKRWDGVDAYNSSLAISELKQIFPELIESEDEKIRKWLISQLENKSDLINNSRELELMILKSIAWLEKQGEKKSMKVYRVENEAEQKGLWRKFDGTYQPLFDMLTDGKCKDLPMGDNPIYREGGKRWFASAPSKETLQKWFSKKDLEELVSKGFTISEFEVVGYKKISDFEYIFTRYNIINRNYLEVSDIYPEQKDSAPKVEPEFKVGDWVMYCGKTYQITGLNNDTFTLTDCNGAYFFNLVESTHEPVFHLWSIKDAKDGDVLVSISDKPFIYNGEFTGLTVGAYCGLTICGEFNDCSEKCNWTNNENIKPATKEQRDTLFAKMKESGYEWEVENKVLKKVIIYERA